MTPDRDDVRADQLAAYLTGARWFGGKGRPFIVTAVTELPLAPRVSTNLVRLSFTDAPAGAPDQSDLYQLPLSSYDEPQARLEHAEVGRWGGQIHYDAVHDREAMQMWLRAFAGDSSSADSRVQFIRVEDRELDLDAHSTVFSGEQSNSSVAFGEDALLKVFRRVQAGLNPDIEIHEVLTRSGNHHIATLYGHVSVEVPGEGTDGKIELGMLQQFLRTASDGWELALASVRNLVMETDLQPEESGGDFAAEAHRLGANLAEVHAVLADAFGTEHLDLTAVSEGMTRRLEAAVAVVPELVDHREPLQAVFAALAQLDDAISETNHGKRNKRSQRIHGDLHLGQLLRTSLGWKFVDFEGEPAKSLDERRLPDSGWRDVAGMIRSFDYAASTVARDLGGSDEAAAETGHRANAWTAHSTAAFLAGYTEQRGEPMTDFESRLLRAYIADKAVYEVIYEIRNRPGWISIPLGALAGIAGEPL
jgi:maltokinase